MPDATGNGRVIFGKNSDRPAGECQVLYRDPGGKHPDGEQAHCSYVTVPRGRRTIATLGMRPYWCWGYETGVNAAGVAGGNAAVFTTGLDSANGLNSQRNSVEPGNSGSRRASEGSEGRKDVKISGKTPGLTGMDLLRLALERRRTAEGCVEEVTTLLAEYGQWGSAIRGKDHSEGSYDNSFLFADATEAWVLETTGRDWAAERTTSGVRTISNELSIRKSFDRASAGVAAARGLDGAPLDFAFAYEDHAAYARQVSHIRATRSCELLMQSAGKVDVESVMRILRDHYEDTFLGGPSFHRYLPDFLTLCMHDSPAGFTWGDTATSMVVELDNSGPGPAWCCYLPPCSSAYLPVFVDENLPDTLTAAGKAGLRTAAPADAPADAFSGDSLWWRMYRLVHAVADDPGRRYSELRAALDPVERRGLATVRSASAPVHSGVTAESGPVSAESRRESRSAIVRELADTLSVAVSSLERSWGLEPWSQY